MSYGREYLFGQLGSSVQAASPPNLPRTPNFLTSVLCLYLTLCSVQVQNSLLPATVKKILSLPAELSTSYLLSCLWSFKYLPVVSLLQAKFHHHLQQSCSWGDTVLWNLGDMGKFSACKQNSYVCLHSFSRPIVLKFLKYFQNQLIY